jgi:multiple sugar transport system substrate-binding protein
VGAASIALLAVTLTGCGRSDAPRSEAAGASVDDEPATGTLEFWAGAPAGDELPAFLDAFEAANPDLDINVTSVPEDQFDTKLTTAIASGDVPDMVYLYSQTQSTLLDTGAFAAVPDGVVDEGSFFESSYDSTLIDGVSFAVPWYSYANIYYYRADIVEELGLTPPTTWDQWSAFLAELQAAGYEHPLGLSVGWNGYSAQQFNDFAHASGGSFLSADGAAWTINSEENVQALEFYATLFDNGYASADGPGFLDTTPWFSSGETVMISNGPWFPGWLDEANGDGWSDEHVGSIVPPAGPNGHAASLGGGSLAVLADAQNQDAAWKLIRYLSGPDVQVDWYDTFGNLPAVETAWSSPAIEEDELLTAVKAAIPSGVNVPEVPTWNQVGQIIGEQMERVARGEATAREVLDEAQVQAEAVGTGT